MQKIMFNDKYGLTKAVLDGKKTQTRRLLPSRNPYYSIKYADNDYHDCSIMCDEDFQKRFDVKISDQYISDENIMCVYMTYLSPSAKQQGFNVRVGNMELLPIHFKPNEIVSIAQSYQTLWKSESDALAISEPSQIIEYFNKHYPEYTTEEIRKSAGYKNKMFVKAGLMPHQIRITNIRLEHLQDISDEDCIKEGIIEDCPGIQYSFPTEIGYCGQYPFDTPKAAYAALIDKISGKGIWEKNPWVFVYDFELVK